jgi:hypothetical protein
MVFHFFNCQIKKTRPFLAEKRVSVLTYGFETFFAIHILALARMWHMMFIGGII